LPVQLDELSAGRAFASTCGETGRVEPTSDEAGPGVVAPGGVAPPVAYSGPGQSFAVDGERFLVRRRLRPEPPFEYDYDWLTGPNAGYGFGSSGPFEEDDDQHTATIRNFLSNIDPATGYLE
jgi:hypothetical protein